MPVRTQPILLALTLSLMYLTGCKNNTTPNETEPMLISDIVFKNSVLRSCVIRAADQVNIKYAAELTSLKCTPVGHGLDNGFRVFGELDREDDLTSGTITSTVGLEKLSGLVQLDLSNHWLAKADLSALKNLKWLNLTGSLVQSLDLSNNNELIELSLGCNPLQQIKLPLQSKLKNLIIKGGSCELTSYLQSDENNEFDEFNNQTTGKPLATIDFEVFPLNYLNLANQHHLTNISITGYHNGDPQTVSFSKSNLPQAGEILELNLHGNNIKTLSLIGFDKLLNLDLGDNILEELDLNQFDLLEHLNYSGNPKIMDLVGYLPKLKSASLNGHVSADDISTQMPELTDLKITGGILKSANFRKNLGTIFITDTTIEQAFKMDLPKLYKLSIYNSDLQEINFSGAPNLLELLIVNYKTNKLTNNSNLEVFHLDLPKLLALNIRSKELLDIDLSGVPNLLDLQLGNNKLKRLDLSKYSNLQKVSVYNNPLNEANTSFPPYVENLSLSNLNFTSFDTNELGTHELVSLSLTDMPIEHINVPHLNNTFNNLTLEGLAITELDLRPFANMSGSLILKSCPKLSTITATGLQNVSFSMLTGLQLDSESSSTLQQLLSN